jgi:S-layer glycoprotein
MSRWSLTLGLLAGIILCGLFLTSAVADTTVSLEQGWNLISVPKVLSPGHNTAATVFSSVDTGGHSIWKYNAQTQTWVKVFPDTLIQPLEGMFVFSIAKTSIPLDFSTDPVMVPPTRPVYQGWNLIGFSGTTPASARDTLISLTNKWSQVLGYDAVSQVYETQIISGGGGAFSDSRMLYPTKGYWLYGTSPGELAGIGS